MDWTRGGRMQRCSCLVGSWTDWHAHQGWRCDWAQLIPEAAASGPHVAAVSWSCMAGSRSRLTQCA